MRSFRIQFAERWWRWKEVRKLRGKEPYWGVTDHARRTVYVERKQNSERDAFNTYLHEAIHASCPWLREWFVERMADELTVLLYDKLRYRRAPEE